MTQSSRTTSTRATIDGVDVTGLSLVQVAHIPGNILEGNIRQVYYVNEEASDEQADAIVDMFRGKLGGPLADIADLVTEVVGVERVPIKHEIVEGAGKLTVGANGEKVQADDASVHRTRREHDDAS